MASSHQNRAEVISDTNVISLDANSLKFPNGNILVILDLHDEEGYWLQLHEAVLESKSGKIAEILCTRAKTLLPADLPLPDPHKVPSNIKRIITLQDDGDPGKLPALTCDLAAAISPPAVVTIGDEDNPANEESGTRTTRGTTWNVPRFRDTFKSLFAAFYDEPLNISRNDIKLALKQSENLVEIAQALDAISAIRAQISNALHEYRQKMYIAIRVDPPRWLNLSLTLESAPIFSESIIHIVGCWPDWLWETSRQTLTPNLVKLIDRKAKILEGQCGEIDRTLLVNTINYGEGDELRSVTLKDDPDAWFAVGIFRDWLVKELTSGIRPSEIGRLYRKLRKGGEAYLTNAEVDPTVDWVGSNVDPDGILKNLGLMKEFASKAVQNICENGLIVSPEALDLGYLTCVDIREEDYPW